MLIVAVSCIDDYTIPDSDTEPMVVIFGQIVSETDCIFTLRSTSRLTGELEMYSYIDDAKVTVKGTDGQIFEAKPKGRSTGQYNVSVGKLDPSQKYYVHVSTIYGDFESEPMQPLDAPELTELYYEQPRADRKIDMVISTEDPKEPVYLLWQVDDYYEIYTPFTSRWEYRFDPGEDPYSINPKGSFVMIDPDQYTNHGWRHSIELSAIATNHDYNLGAISKRCICQRPNFDHRFQTRCCTRVRQIAITREEYEYRNMMKEQWTDVGGLFSKMPSELPTNIRSLGNRKAIGYIGVRGHVSTKEMYVNRHDFDYHSMDVAETIPEKMVGSPQWMVNNGYGIFSHDPNKYETIWTYRWCIDYRDDHWGGSEAMERPEFWNDK